MTTADQWAEVCRLWAESGREGSPWRPGMRLFGPDGQGPCLLVGVADVLHVGGPHKGKRQRQILIANCTPDPNDPTGATNGALLGLVREVWGDGRACCKWDEQGWFAQAGAYPGAVLAAGTTEAEALLAALIAGLQR